MREKPRPHYTKVAQIINWLLDEIEREERLGQAGANNTHTRGDGEALAG